MIAAVRRTGEGERHEIGPSTIILKATSDETAGKLFLAETTLGVGGAGPPPHVHETLHDMFYVLEGTLAVRLGDDEVPATAGTFVCVPPNTVHTFSNRSDAPVRLLHFNAPGGWEGYMRDLAAAAAEGRELSPDEIIRIASRYDFRSAPGEPSGNQ